MSQPGIDPAAFNAFEAAGWQQKAAPYDAFFASVTSRVADALLDAAGDGLRCMRDATRGGVASVLNELARSSGVAMIVSERDVPVTPVVAGAAEILGIDPMYVANEGVFVAIVAPDVVVEGFAEIGEVKTEPPGMVLVRTSFGGKRVMDELVGDPLPRIC